MDYFTERNIKMKINLNRILSDMPPFCRMFFFGKEQKLAMRTLYEHMYIQTRDIYMVANLLGHKDVKTTTKHYTTIEEELKRKAICSYSIA